jgi:hypothetical protein
MRLCRTAMELGNEPNEEQAQPEMRFGLASCASAGHRLKHIDPVR